ncbi:MAG: type II toxin-antitoxin system VapC family toxin [Candidatus Methanoperedens sp.]|nr:type II toxin-antitoxin system VapC family toxin [Candidatus Methanoperedens sp.]MCZ7370035.1 type II toxin-antitoxin system VapC family toxin [Candidatus Methanoperedens sp.]
MSGRFILDTNIVIAIFSGETSIKEHLLKADEVFISSIVLGELFFGAFKSKHSKTNLKRISDFADSITILTCDKNTAYQYGMVKNKLIDKGKPIPENDIWIAAVAMQNDLILVTRDGHFGEIEDLKYEKW